MSYNPFLNSIIPLPRLRATSGRRLPNSSKATTNNNIISQERTPNMMHSSQYWWCQAEAGSRETNRLDLDSRWNNESSGLLIRFFLRRRLLIVDSGDTLLELCDTLAERTGQRR